MLRLLYLKKCLILYAFIIILCNCTGYQTVKRKVIPADLYQTLDSRSPFLKAHTHNGKVYVFSEWSVDSEAKLVKGQGVLLSVNRDTLNSDNFIIAIDSVAIFETNILEHSPAVTALTIITGISAAITVACITNPKACFGSCPTFYVSDGDHLLLQAEGFSSSIAPPLETSDIDALYRAKPTGRNFRIEMRNEALETHVIRYADILALPRTDNSRVLKDVNEKFWYSQYLLPPTFCQGPEGNCLSLIKSFDGNERFSLADSNNLSKREILEIEFNNIPEGPTGLVIGARQTLLSTFLLYQTLSYMGSTIGKWFTMIEQFRHNPSTSQLGNILGRIEVFYQDENGNWQYVGEAGEYGPLATDVYLIPLPLSNSLESIKLRLQLTKGNWRIDYLSLAELERTVSPLKIKPSFVLKNGLNDDHALSLLCDSSKVLTTLPGDTYTIEYLLPKKFNQYELFLQSRGYYLEWMRQEWLEEENQNRLVQMLFSTDTALKELAPVFKKIEMDMEDSFWRSRYAKP